MAAFAANPGSAAAAPLPPLPDFSSQANAGPAPQADPMASLISGIAPVKGAVDSILAACKSIVQSGAIPGGEQVCGQIVALATSLLPMAAQQALQPGMGGGPSQGPSAPQGIAPLGAGGQ